VLDYRQAAGTVPAGATRARVTITLTTTLTDWNGPDAPQTGYNYATAADIGLTLNQPAPATAPLTPPAADVPGYQHVFLFYFENEDYSQVIGNAKQAPYLNSLRRGGATLTNFYAEEHPSDANYLALAGGSAFGVPLTDPEEENPLYTIDAANIGDLIAGSGESWKAYLQSANGPCDDTVHGYYWNDDQPMMYFQDVHDRPRYCARHVVPLEELGSDGESRHHPEFRLGGPRRLRRHGRLRHRRGRRIPQDRADRSRTRRPGAPSGRSRSRWLARPPSWWSPTATRSR